MVTNAQKSYNELFEGHLDLVASITGYFARRCSIFLSYDEIYQWGMIGLWDACKRYVGPKDQFSFYARRRIKGQIIDEIRHSTPFRVRRKRSSSGVMPKVEPLDIARLASNDVLPDELANINLQKARVAELLHCLTEREAYIIVMFFIEGRTLTDLGVELGVTEARVCQIKDAALDKLMLAALPTLEDP